MLFSDKAMWFASGLLPMPCAAAPPLPLRYHPRMAHLLPALPWGKDRAQGTGTGWGCPQAPTPLCSGLPASSEDTAMHPLPSGTMPRASLTQQAPVSEGCHGTAQCRRQVTHHLPAKQGAAGQQPLPAERPASTARHLSAVTTRRSRQMPAPSGAPGERSCWVCI